MLCILHDAHRVCVLGVRRQMVGQKSPALLAVFKKADKKGGDLRSVWGALKEEPCSWGNAQRQSRAWRAEQGVAPAAKTPAAKTPAAKPKPAGGAAASTAARTKAVQLYTGQGGCRVALAAKAVQLYTGQGGRLRTVPCFGTRCSVYGT